MKTRSTVRSPNHLLFQVAFRARWRFTSTVRPPTPVLRRPRATPGLRRSHPPPA